MRALNPKELLIPAAIVIAGIILALGIYVVRIHHTVTVGTGDPENVRPVTPDDHFIGNPSAPVAIIEYGDVDSSYTKTFQRTMAQIMTEYASGDQVVWVYRHFPITSEHPNSASNAMAAECAASLSTPLTFFHFIDAMQSAAPESKQFSPQGYAALVSQFGINPDSFAKCMTSNTYEKRVHDDYSNALASGAKGSPFVILLVRGQKPVPINGALPYTAMKKLIEEAIKKVK